MQAVESAELPQKIEAIAQESHDYVTQVKELYKSQKQQKTKINNVTRSVEAKERTVQEYRDSIEQLRAQELGEQVCNFQSLFPTLSRISCANIVTTYPD